MAHKEFFQKFLSEFSSKDVPKDDDPLPFRLQSYSIAEAECKGEILDWAIVYLETADCPDFLKFSIACQVAKSLLSSDLDQYKQTKESDNEEDSVVCYAATPLARATFRTIHELCSEWNQKFPEHLIPPNLNKYSVCGIKNTRRKMEDKHAVITDLNALLGLKDQPHTQYYGVFDGHGGLDASLYTAKQLHLNLVQQESFTTDLEEALKKSILEMDEEYCKKANRESLRSGTTAVVAVIRENALYLSWIGDSQAVLVRDGKPVILMEPHKPDREDEKQRIESLGGCVIWFGAWRVNGTLSVSRAIGDADHKPYVCGQADTSKTEFTGNEEYLCVACDGFWDVFTGDQLVNLVSDHMREGGDKNTLARALCLKAKAAGSTDNITVLIVFLRDKITILESTTAEAESVENKDNEEKNNEVPKNEANGGTGMKMATENKNVNTIASKEGTPIDGNVMVQGSRLQPALKDRPPHKLYVNKPQTLNSKVSVIVTESSPHRKLPHTVVTHKSPWYSPQVSPKMKRRDTRGSLMSWGTCDSDEMNQPFNLWARESQINGYFPNAHGFFPALVPEKSGGLTSNRTSPSPSCASEPTISDGKIVANSVYHPTRPSVQRQVRGRLPYRTSIIMNNEERGQRYSQHLALQQRRLSYSVPESLHKINEAYSRRRKPRPQSIKSESRTSQATKRFSLNKEAFEPLTNLTLHEITTNTVPDTDIVITNSLYNTIKPKKMNREKEYLNYNPKNLAKMPVRVLYRRQRSRSVL